MSVEGITFGRNISSESKTQLLMFELVGYLVGYKFASHSDREGLALHAVHELFWGSGKNIYNIDKLKERFYSKSEKEKQEFAKQLFVGVELKPKSYSSLFFDIAEKIWNYAELMLNPIAYLMGSYHINLGFILCGRVSIDIENFDKSKFVECVKAEQDGLHVSRG